MTTIVIVAPGNKVSDVMKSVLGDTPYEVVEIEECAGLDRVKIEAKLLTIDSLSVEAGPHSMSAKMVFTPDQELKKPKHPCPAHLKDPPWHRKRRK